MILKIGSKSTKPNQLTPSPDDYEMLYLCKFGNNPSILLSDMVQKSHFSTVNILSSCDVENRVKVAEIYSVLPYLQIIQLSIFDLNQLILSGDIIDTRHLSTFYDPRDLKNEIKVTKI